MLKKKELKVGFTVLILLNQSALAGIITNEKYGSTMFDISIVVEESKNFKTTVDIVQGMQFDRGYRTQVDYIDTEKKEIALDEPYILIPEKKVSKDDLTQVLKQIKKTGKPLLIIAEDIEDETLGDLEANKLRGTINVAAVKTPGFGDRRKEMLRDIAVLTGGTVITEELGLKPENLTLDHLGRAKRIVVDKDSTTIMEGAGQKHDVDAYLKRLHAQVEVTTSDYDKEKLQERLAKLAGGVAVIKVGAATEVEIKEKKARIKNELGDLKRRAIRLAACSAITKVIDHDAKTEHDRDDVQRQVAPRLELDINSGTIDGIITHAVVALASNAEKTLLLERAKLKLKGERGHNNADEVLSFLRTYFCSVEQKQGGAAVGLDTVVGKYDVNACMGWLARGGNRGEGPCKHDD